VILLAIVLIGCFIYRRKYILSDGQHQSRNADTDLIGPSSNANPENNRFYYGVPLFSYKELKEATYNFHHTRQLGSGGFGTVYYGKPFSRIDVIHFYIFCLNELYLVIDMVFNNQENYEMGEKLLSSVSMSTTAGELNSS